MASLQDKINDSRKYAWEQIENWLRVYYNTPLQVEVHASRDVYKEGRLAKTVFDGTPTPKIYIDYNLLKSGNKKNILYSACREACRIGLAYHNLPHSDLDKEFRAELRKHKLPDYGGLSETGMSLYTYRCVQCKKAYALRTRPMKFKDKEKLCYNPHVTTECCGKMVEDAGKVFYKNEDLQELAKTMRLDLEAMSK